MFSGTSDLDGGNPDNGFEVRRMQTDGTSLERLTTDASYDSLFPDISADGSRIVFESESDILGQNADHNSEIFLYEPGAPTPMRQLTQTTDGSNTKARLTRDGEYAYFFSQPGMIRYDVVRGDVADLQDLGGGIIDLGAVVCVEDDSADTTTVGFEDTVTPALGQALFYVFRGSMGLNAGPGSYGTGSNGSERVAGVGGCAP